MESSVLLQELENLAERLNVTVRYEEGDFKGGLCRVKDEQLLIINKKLPDERKIIVLASEISKFDLSGMYIIPKLRESISEFTHSS